MKPTAWVVSALVLAVSSAPALPDTPVFRTETVDADGDVGRYTSLALDTQGNPHIAYLKFSTVKYASRSPAGWTIEDAASGRVSSNRSLGLDSHDVPYIVFESSSYSARIATRDNGGWSETTKGGYAIWWAALDIDGNDQTHLAYMWSIGMGEYEGFIDYDSDGITTNLFVPKNPCCSLVMDAQNEPHVLVCPNEPDSMVLWEHAGWRTWKGTPVGVGSWGALALDDAGTFHLACYDPVQQDLVYGVLTAGAWTFEPVDEAGDVGKYPSLVVDDAGVHISYYDVTNGDLKLASRSAPGEAWVLTTVDAAGDVGEFSSLRVHNGAVHISYYDRTHGDLRYALGGARVRTWGGVKALYRGGQPGRR